MTPRVRERYAALAEELCRELLDTAEARGRARNCARPAPRSNAEAEKEMISAECESCEQSHFTQPP